MNDLIQDLKYSARVMRSRPGFSLVVVLSLALGIAATTAIFSLINNLLFRPLPFEDGERVVRLRDALQRPGEEPRLVGMSAANFEALKEQTGSFVDVGTQDYGDFNLTGPDTTERVEGAYITANVFPLLGVEPMLGRNFTAEEARPGARARVVLLGHDLWRRQYGRDPGVLGQQIRLNDDSYTVIGVMPPAYKFPYDSELWVPINLETTSEGPQHVLYTVARLKPGVSREQAQRELDTIGARLAREFPETNEGWSFAIESVREDLTDEVQAKLMYALLAGSGFLLLIACANVANMMLVRALEQRRDIAIRAALGANRGRLVRQFVTHGLLVAVLSGALGVLLSQWLARPMVAFSPIAEMTPFLQELRLDYRILGFAVLLSLVVGVAFSLVPAFRFSRPNLTDSLEERSTSGAGGRRLLKGFVVAEVALAVMLLIGAALTIGSFQRLLDVDAGFPTDGLLRVNLAFAESKYPEHSDRIAFLDQAMERIRALPGVTSADVTSTFVLGGGRVATLLTIEGRQVSEDDEYIANHRVVGPQYLETVGMPLVKGRWITDRDRGGTEPVVVVSETFADRYWPNEEPLGKRVKRGGPGSDRPWMTVVGVVGDVIDEGDFGPTWYVPATQMAFPFENVTLMVRSSTPPRSQVEPIRRAIQSIDRGQPIYEAATVNELILQSYGEQRFSMYLFSLFGGLGLILAMLGIYGILSYAVVQQRREMGLRLALGAAPRQILNFILLQGLLLASFGVALGLLAAYLLARFLGSLLYEISPADPSTYLAIGLITLAVALVASYLPARRAIKVDPMTVLKV